MSQNRWRLRLCPRPHWGSLERSPDLLTGFKEERKGERDRKRKKEKKEEKIREREKRIKKERGRRRDKKEKRIGKR